jgi:protoheme IX farnesyltransferase
MLSLVDASGKTCFRQIMVQSTLLVLISFLPYCYGIAGKGYLVTALITGTLFLWLGRRLQRSGSRQDAVRLFLYSLAYLPVVLIAMAIDRQILFVG